MSLINPRAKEAGKKILQICLEINDVTAVVEACAIITASACRMIAIQEKMSFEEVYTEVCAHACKQSETNVISLADFRKRSDHESNP